MVVVVESRIGEAVCLGLGEHAEGHAGLESQRFDAFDHFDDMGQVAVLRRAPGCTHAEASRSFVTGCAGGFEHAFDFQQFFPFQGRVVMAALGAVGAVFGAGTGLD